MTELEVGDRLERRGHPKMWDDKTLCYCGNGEEKIKTYRGKRKDTRVPLCIFPFLRLFSFCTQWVDVPFALLNSAIEILHTTNSQE